MFAIKGQTVSVLGLQAKSKASVVVSLTAQLSLCIMTPAIDSSLKNGCGFIPIKFYLEILKFYFYIIFTCCKHPFDFFFQSFINIKPSLSSQAVQKEKAGQIYQPVVKSLLTSSYRHSSRDSAQRPWSDDLSDLCFLLIVKISILIGPIKIYFYVIPSTFIGVQN